MESLVLLKDGVGYVVALIGLGLMVGAAGGGSAWGLGITGSAVIGAIKRKPEAFGTSLVLAALPSSQGLYGFVAFVLYSNIIAPDISLLQGAVVLGAGIAIGLACLISAIHQGNICANGIAAIGGGHNVFGNTLILAVFPELYAILSLVAAILMMGLKVK
ncbi:v-type H+-transporting ATPase subunit K [Fibrobacteres bacterium R8-0-B4]